LSVCKLVVNLLKNLSMDNFVVIYFIGKFNTKILSLKFIDNDIFTNGMLSISNNINKYNYDKIILQIISKFLILCKKIKLKQQEYIFVFFMST